MAQTTLKLLLAVFLFGGCAAKADLLFQDVFSNDPPGTQLNTSEWTTQTGPGSTVGRTHLTNWVNGGGQFDVGPDGADLTVNTYDPNNPGVDLYGTNAKTIQDFQPGETTPVIFTTQLQLTSLQGGLVYGMYLFDCPTTQTSCSSPEDEIDIEVVTNYLQSGSPMEVELNRFINGEPDSGYGGLFDLPTGFNPLGVNDWTISWSQSEIDYYVNGVLLDSVTNAMGTIPQGPLEANVIGFAPNSNWTDAYDAALDPASSPSGNQAFTALLTSVTVSEVPEPSTWVLILIALPILYRFRLAGSNGMSARG